MLPLKDWYVLEVAPDYRSGRGRFWRPNAAGYTDDPAQAGVYAVTSRDVRNATAEHYTARPLSEILDEMRAEINRATRAHEALASRAMDAAIAGRDRG